MEMIFPRSAGGPEHFVGDGHGPPGFPHIVHPDDLRPGQDRRRGGGEGRFKPVMDRETGCRGKE